MLSLIIFSNNRIRVKKNAYYKNVIKNSILPFILLPLFKNKKKNNIATITCFRKFFVLSEKKKLQQQYGGTRFFLFFLHNLKFFSILTVKKQNLAQKSAFKNKQD